MCDLAICTSRPCPDAFPSADRVTRTGASVCPKVSASVSTKAGKIVTVWGRDYSRTPLTSKGARTFVQEMFAPEIGNTNAQQIHKKSNLNTAVRLRSWNRAVDVEVKSSPTSVGLHPALTRGPDDALLLCSSILKRCYSFSEGGQTWWFCGQVVVPITGHSSPIRAESGGLLTNPLRANVLRIAGSQGRLTLRELLFSCCKIVF